MRYFDCPHCAWSYIIGRKRVYGPMYQTFPGIPGHQPRMMTRAEFKKLYNGCAYLADKAATP
jgi:hypothetical protein